MTKDEIAAILREIRLEAGFTQKEDVYKRQGLVAIGTAEGSKFTFAPLAFFTLRFAHALPPYITSNKVGTSFPASASWQ